MAGSADRKRRRFQEKGKRRMVDEYLRRALSSRAPVDASFVLGLHSLMVLGTNSSPSEGYREIPVRVRWGKKIVYVAPAPEGVPALMRGFFDWVAADQSPDHVRSAGRAMLRLLKIHPFREGNGRTARAIATYMLFLNDYSQRPLRTLEKYVDSNLTGYYEALASSGVEFPGPWDAFFSSAVSWAFRAPDAGRLAGALAPVIDRFRSTLK